MVSTLAVTELSVAPGFESVTVAETVIVPPDEGRVAGEIAAFVIEGATNGCTVKLIEFAASVLPALSTDQYVTV